MGGVGRSSCLFGAVRTSSGRVGVGRGPAPSCFPDREDGTVAATTAASAAAEEDLEKTKRASAGKAKEEA